MLKTLAILPFCLFILASCGGSSDTPKPLKITSTPNDLELRELEPATVSIGFINADHNNVTVTVTSEAPIEHAVSIIENEAKIFLQPLQIINDHEGFIMFTLSDGIDTDNILVQLTIENTSGNALVDTLELQKNQLSSAYEFPEEQSIMEAYARIANISGVLSDSEYADYIAGFSRLIDNTEPPCTKCTVEFINDMIQIYRAGNSSETKLSTILPDIFEDLNDKSANLVEYINVIGNSSHLPNVSFSDYKVFKGSIFGFIGNESLGSSNDDYFIFNSQFSLFNKLFASNTLYSECQVNSGAQKNNAQ